MPSNGGNSTKKCCKGCRILTKILYEGGHRRLKNEGSTKCILQRKKSFHGKPITKKSVKCLYKKMVNPLVNAKANLREMKHVNFNNDLSLHSTPTSVRYSSGKLPNASPGNDRATTKVNGSNNNQATPKTRQICLKSSVPGSELQTSCGDSLLQNQIKTNSSKVKTENQIKNTSHKTKTENTGTTVYGTPLNSPSGLVVRNIPLLRTSSRNSLRKSNQLQSSKRCTVDNIDQLMERLDRIHNMERRAACLELYNFKQMYCKDITDETKVLNKMIQKGVSYNALRLQLDLMEAKDSSVKKISLKGNETLPVPVKPKVHSHEKTEHKKNDEIAKCKKPVINNNHSKQLKIFRNYLCDIGKPHQFPSEGCGSEVEKYAGKNKDGKLILQAQFSDGNHPLIMQYFSYPEHIKQFAVKKK